MSFFAKKEISRTRAHFFLHHRSRYHLQIYISILIVQKLLIEISIVKKSFLRRPFKGLKKIIFKIHQ